MARPYRIVGNPRPIVDHDPETGHVVEGYEVHALDTEHGAHAQVFVPRRIFSPATVDAYIQHALDLLHDVKQLPGSLTQG